ncbi:MAG: Rv3654c family TadE-like protein [Pontimonas sp.]
MVLALGVIAMLVIAGTAAGVAVDLVRCGQKVQHAANLSALAASDVATGVIAGRPCVVAREIARAQGIRLASCEVTGSTARVYASTTRHGFSIVKRAAAGPLPGGVWRVGGDHAPWGENRP